MNIRMRILIGCLMAVVIGGALYGVMGYRPFFGSSYERMREQIVFIRSEITGSGTESPEQFGSGSGFIIGDRDRPFVVTNHHVVARDTKYFVYFKSLTEFYEVKKYAWSNVFDLAVLTFVGERAAPHARARLGVSDGVAVGDRVYFMGNPFGIKFLWTEGIVMQPKVYIGFSPIGLIAIDGTCNPGNSGGPAMRNGKVVGIVVAITGIGNRSICFAIPVDVLRGILPRFAHGGEMMHGSLGLMARNSWELTPDEQKMFSVDVREAARQVVVVNVIQDSPISRADIKKNDFLVAFGKSMDALESIMDVRVFVERLSLSFFRGDEVVFMVRRGHEYFFKKIILTDPATWAVGP